ncbi:MAG: hypothetical protein IPP74_13690 [Alphaproteobacteria bacterium]|nr:hypothetical protein [Alphaproteobacteria bacterium]
MPIIGASIGVSIELAHRPCRSAPALLTVLCGSASISQCLLLCALPCTAEAKAAIYVPMSLAITFL